MGHPEPCGFASSGHDRLLQSRLGEADSGKGCMQRHTGSDVDTVLLYAVDDALGLLALRAWRYGGIESTHVIGIRALVVASQARPPLVAGNWTTLVSCRHRFEVGGTHSSTPHGTLAPVFPTH